MRIGIDLGGTKIEAIALDAQGRTLTRRRVSTPHSGYGDTLDAIVGLVGSVEQELVTKGSVGIGTPGAVSRVTGRIKNSNSTCLNGQPLREDLETRLDRPVRLANDADCFALSEAMDGAGKGARTVWGVILGTGAGSGVVVEGKLLRGCNAIAGEWGHNPLYYGQAGETWQNLEGAEKPPRPLLCGNGERLCNCGRLNCVETYVSGTGLEMTWEQATGQRASGLHIAAEDRAGNPNAAAVLARYESHLARALATVINVLDPDVVVLGGGLSNLTRLYSNVPRLWLPHIFTDRVETRLVRAVHGDSSGVRGAAWLWPN